MTKNPVINGISASAYILLVALVMNYGTQMAPHSKSFIVPVAVLSMFTLSAAVMGFLFGYQPAQLYFSGDKKQAVKLFLQTVAVFAVLTALAMVLAFSGIFS